jgi:hypothetical protein
MLHQCGQHNEKDRQRLVVEDRAGQDQRQPGVESALRVFRAALYLSTENIKVQI